MTQSFDPYYKWLGIPPDEQPANHYRLLGVPLFIDDLDVIQNAADRQMAHVRTYQSGAYGAVSQRLLNEISAAKVCLLNERGKAKYDQTLRQKLGQGRGDDAPQVRVKARQPAVTAAKEEGDAAPKVRRRRRTPLWKHPGVLITVVSLALMVFLLYKLAQQNTDGETPGPIASGTSNTTSGGGASNNTAANNSTNNSSSTGGASTTTQQSGGTNPTNSSTTTGGGNTTTDPGDNNTTNTTAGSLNPGSPDSSTPGNNPSSGSNSSPPPTPKADPEESFAKAQEALAEKRVTDLKNLLQSYLRNSEAKQREEAQKLLTAVQRATSDSESINYLRKLSYNDYQQLSAGKLAVNVDFGYEKLGEVFVDQLRRNLSKVTPPKPAVPSQSEQTAALATLRQTLGSEFAAAQESGSSDALRTEMAKQLTTTAKSESDSALSYVMLHTAMELSSSAVDLNGALTAAEQIQQSFDIAPEAVLKLKNEALSKISDKASREQAVPLVDEFRKLIEELLRHEQFAAAEEMSNVAQKAAAKTRDKALRADMLSAKNHIKAVSAAYDDAKSAFDTLQSNPDDPEANLAVGRFRCFMLGDYKRGLQNLLKAPEKEPLHKLAKAEESNPRTTAGQLALGEDWWAQSRLAKGQSKSIVQQHACDWYYKALVGMSDPNEKVALYAKIDEAYPNRTAPDWVSLIDSEKQFRNYWRDDFDAQTVYDAATRTITVDTASYDLGGISYGREWVEAYFEVAPVVLQSGQFEVELGSEFMEIGPAILQYRGGAAVSIKHDPKSGMILLAVAGKVIHRRKFYPGWGRNFYCTFDSDSSFPSRFQFRNIKVRVPADQIPQR